jgi:hypothetical protein
MTRSLSQPRLFALVDGLRARGVTSFKGYGLEINIAPVPLAVQIAQARPPGPAPRATDPGVATPQDVKSDFLCAGCGHPNPRHMPTGGCLDCGPETSLDKCEPPKGKS